MTKRQKFALGLSMVVALLGSLFTTVALSGAWFTKAADLTPGWNGSSDGAYFAYGNGVARNEGNEKDQPYGISSPRHLYNLAWLQYLGYFSALDGNNYTTYYFELANDVDMTGWTLPPIGTKEYPFLGNFSGNGHKITGLTVSNDLGDYNQKPFGITESDFPNEINILGLFGVVGSYEGGQDGKYTTATNQITNTGISGLTVESHSTTILIGLAAGYVNGTLSGVAVNDSYLDLSDSGGAAITSITSNLSDYSLIGHAANDAYLETLKRSTTRYDDPLVYNPYVTAGGDEWGGSIPMSDMYSTLSTKMKAGKKYSSEEYTTFEEETRTDNGNDTYTPTSGYTPIPENTQTDSFTDTDTTHQGVYLYDGVDTATDSKGETVTTGSYTFGSSKSSSSLSSDAYVGLLGHNEIATYNYIKQSDTVASKTGFRLYDYTGGAATNYFVYNGSFISSTTTENNGSILILDDSNHLYVNVNQKNYYLTASGGTLSMSEVASSTWTWNSTYSAWKTGSYYLVCVDGDWRLVSNTTYSDTYYLISNNGNYYFMANLSQGVFVGDNPATATRWYYETSGTNYIYTLINGQKYYVNYSVSNNSLHLNLSTTLDSDVSLYKYNNYLRFSYYSTTYNLYINSSGGLAVSQYSNSNYRVYYNSASTGYVLKTQQSGSVSTSITTYTQTSTPNSIYSRETYFPLTWAENSTTEPSDKNTGYVISGSKYSTDSNESIGDIRFSSYYKTTMFKNSNTNTSTTFSNSQFFPYSFNQSGTLVKIGDPVNGLMNTSGYTPYTDTSLNGTGFKKYYSQLLTRTTGSRYTLGNALTSDSTAYGLHFMNADISMDNLITVPYAKINNVEYYGYQLPRDAIDFNLKSDGYVNFFAHTAFSNNTSASGRASSKSNANWNNSNNSFFSLHWIDRNGNNINTTKQIAKIYHNTEYDTDETQPQYVYTFRDSSDNEVTSVYNASSNTNGYHTGIKDTNGLITGTKGNLIFDTYWLTDPEYSKFELDAVYYFEIPVNKGEYALGSTSGKTKYARGWGNSYTSYNKNGAYLIYLDIGASQKNSSAITIDEHSETTTYTYKYPKGVDYSDLTTLTMVAAYSAVQGGTSSAIRLTAVEANKINIEYNYTAQTNNSDAILTVGPDNGNGTYTATYITIDTQVKNGASTAISVDNSTSSVDVMDREILYDLTTNTNNYVVTEKHTIDGVEQDEVRVTTTETWTEDQIEAIASFETADEHVLFTLAYNVSGTDAVTLETSFNVITNTYTLNFVSTAGGQSVNARFLTLNLNPTYTIESTSITKEYTVVVMNNGATEATITKTNMASYVGVDMALVAAVKSS